MKKRILVIDDDPFHFSVIGERIRNRWTEVDFEFQSITNEKSFMLAVEKGTSMDFDLVIIDQLMPYTSQDDPDFADKAALKLDAFRAGTRCYEALQREGQTQKVPAIFYTILGRETVPPGVPYVKKSGDLELTELLQQVALAIPDLAQHSD